MGSQYLSILLIRLRQCYIHRDNDSLPRRIVLVVRDYATGELSAITLESDEALVVWTLDVANSGVFDLDCDGIGVSEIRGFAAQFNFITSFDVDELIVGVLDSGYVVAVDVDRHGLSSLFFHNVLRLFS